MNEKFLMETAKTANEMYLAGYKIGWSDGYDAGVKEACAKATKLVDTQLDALMESLK
jgi:flagellar biosynthesis/type III secretory pathway protein FliH